MGLLRVAVTTTSFGPPETVAHRRLLDADLDVVVSSLGRRPTEGETIEMLDDAVGVVAGTGPLTERVFERAPSLRVISRVGVGIDSIDVAAAEARGIPIYTTPEALTDSVAELTLGLMLAALRRITEADRGLRGHEWQPLMGTLLKSKRVGVIGLGRIGRRVAELVTTFGADVVVCDPFVDASDWQLVDLDELVATSDIVTLHVPLLPETQGLLNDRRLRSMRRGGVVINAARGGLIDEEALYRALDDGVLAAAGLDCYAEEPYAGPLTNLPNVVVTAHMGSYAAEARERMELDAVENLLDGLKRAELLT
jgi:D-3-phosphoglycerate dehydrogenase / 2-oxoglutarate reductase